jgi:IS5 family transposase
MFRTSVRQFATTATRAAGVIPKLTIAEINAGSRKAIEISKAQGVAQRSLVDGTSNARIWLVAC